MASVSALSPANINAKGYRHPQKLPPHALHKVIVDECGTLALATDVLQQHRALHASHVNDMVVGLPAATPHCKLRPSQPLHPQRPTPGCLIIPFDKGELTQRTSIVPHLQQ
jgi:hypothetical protein